MRRYSFIKSFLAVVFAGVVLFTVNVQEVHYLFTEHGQHEHCENHLHGQDKHDDCAVCKFHVTFFSDAVAFENISNPDFVSKPFLGFYQSPVADSQINFASLRGPPASA